MSQRIALVTGGMGGIGSSIAQKLWQEGYKVVVTYNKDGDHDTAQKWQQHQKQQGYDFHIVFCDVTDFESVAMMVNEVENEVGLIQVLVNNAGITQDRTLRKMSVAEWYQVMDANLTSVFNTCRAVIHQMIDSQFGRIINISSINGQKGQIGQCNYAASKAGMHGFTKSLAQEVASKGITVNTISPGYIRTPMTTKMAPEILESIIQQIPVGRLGEPDEVADMVSFLAKDESAFITGANFSLNGGQYLS